MKAVMGKDWVMKKHVEKWPKNIRPVPGFRGYYMVIVAKRTHTTFDSRDCGVWCEPGATIISTSCHDRLVALSSWRCKKNGKEYGAKWVSMRGNTGKKKYVKLETLATEIFGEKWAEVKQQIEVKASQATLGELF